MSKKPFLTMLSTAAITAVAALSVPRHCRRRGAQTPKRSRRTRSSATTLYIVRMAEMPVSAYDGGIKGLKATRPRKGQKIDPNSPAVVSYKGFLESRHDAVLAAVGGAQEALQLRLRVQRLRRRTDRRAGREAGADARRAGGDQGRDPRSSTPRTHAGLPRPDRPGGFWATTGQGRERHHRHRRQRHLAGAPELLRPHRRQRQRHARTASSATSRSPAGTASACRRGVQRRRTATRS